MRDPAAHQFAVDRVRTAVHELGASASELADSPILGGRKGIASFSSTLAFEPRGCANLPSRTLKACHSP